MNQPILLYRSGSVYANETAAWAALDAVTHKKGQPIVAFYTLSSPVIGHHGSSTIGAIFAIGIGDGVGQYKACTSHDDMLIVAQSLNAHITQFNQMFEYDANHNAIKAKLDFYTTDGKSISAGGIGSGSSASLGALYQLVDVMANSSNTGVEGAVEGSVLAYDATAGKWKAIAQSEILPDMSGYYTKDETDSAINTAKSNLQGQVDTLQALIPATASADNQLADKDFVNSSIATATAEFRGSFTSLDELKATSGNLNDYAFYLHTDSVGNSIVDRYKWTTAGWLYEYTLNNSSFTAEQWAALNSAITATLVQSYNSHLKNSTIHITAAERTAWNNKWDYNEATIKAVKVNAAVSADKLATANEGTSAIPIYFKNGKPAQCIPSDLFSGFANAYSSTGERSLGITIAGHTRMVVVAYSTLAGSADKLATARKIWGQPFDGSADVSGDLIDVGNITASGKATIQGDIVCGGEVVAIAGEGTPAGVTDYSALTGKPAINGVTLVSGNNTLAALGIQAAGDYATNSGVTTLLADYTTKTFVANNYAGKSAFNSHIADTNIHITSAERAAWDSKWDYDEATIKAVKVTAASSADSVAWSGISGKPTTFTPSAHTHTASDVSGLPTSLKNPYALTFGSKTYDGSAAATITASDLGALTSITKSMVEGVLTGDITSHTHTFASLTSKPTTIAGYGITDALTTSNYNSYAPTLTGTGASGTWGINISGNAAKATYATSARNIIGGLWSEKSNPNLLTAWNDWDNESHIGYGGFSYGIYSISQDPTHQFLLGADALEDGLFFRRKNSGGWGDWKVIAFTDSNVASATKLQTPRTLWGKLFDGSANVDGDLIDVGNITASGKATIQGDIVCGGEVVAIAGEGTPAGVTDYSALTGKPQINGVTLVSGNNTLAALGIQAAGDYVTNSGVTTLLANYADKTFVANNYASKTAFNSHTADSDIHITAAERAAWDAKWDYNENTIKAVKVNSASSADSVAWSGISGKPTTFTPSAHTHTASEVSGLPTSLKNPYALSFGSKTYDGSAAATITASDLGALTAHQSIYALTLQVNGTSKGVYNPASAAKTINIAVPTKTSDITNDSGFITSASIPTALKNPYAVEIKANGVSLGTYDGSAAATFNLSAANVGAANRVHSHTASEISGLPTNLSAFTNDVGYITGITKSMVEGVLTGNITSHTHTFASLTSKPTTIAGYGITDAYTATTIDNKLSGYLPLSGGTISNQLSIDYNSVYPLVLNGLKNYSVINFRARGTDVSDVGWLNDYRGNLSYIANISYSGVISVNYDGVYYSDEFTNYKKYTIIHTGNYNSYAPTLTGTGASGTWGIDISGNASSATKLQDNTAFTVWGQTFFENGKPKNVSGDLNVGASKLYWNGDTEGSFISSIGMTHMTYEMRGGHNFCVGGDEILRIRKYGDYNLEVNGTGHITGDLIVDGEVSALVA